MIDTNVGLLTLIGNLYAENLTLTGRNQALEQQITELQQQLAEKKPRAASTAKDN